ncbi:MAG: DEAD/DEAH box helicase family protein [Candidatus Bathyarchaeota archaeon]|nr:MAG: DEAD/DEAH box helicase family protein [Candidatus Bathyarchaeota archaeon]
MEIGSFVRSKAYKEKGLGRVIDEKQLFGQQFCEVYFYQANETLRLPVADLKPEKSALDAVIKGEAHTPEEFFLLLVNKQIKSYLTQQGLLAPNNFRIIPLPHQLIAVNSVIEHFRPRCLFADEVGLGKTIEAALVYEELALRNIVKRVLVIAPAGLTTQWKDEMLFKFGEEFRIINSQSFKTLKELYGQNTNPWALYDKIITSIDFVKPRKITATLSPNHRQAREEHNSQVSEALTNANWDMVIIDEAHKLSKKEHTGETARYKIAYDLAQSVPVLLLLTATPHQGDSEKFLHLLALLDPYRFYSIDQLTPENVKQIAIRNSKRAAVDYDRKLLFKPRVTTLKEISRTKLENKIELELYHEVSEYVKNYYKLAERENNHAFIFLLLLYQRMVSSSSKAVYHSLKGRLENLRASILNLQCLPSQENLNDDFEEQDTQTIYEKLTHQKIELNDIEAVKAEIKILEKCVNLALRAWQGRQDEKIKQVIQIINETIRRENNPALKFLIFTEFIWTQEYLGNTLEAHRYKVAYINGKMTQEERLLQKSKFSKDHQILISTDAGGEGINLQFCHVIINYDLPWNPMKIEQRIGRIDRIGQENTVIAINLVLKDTIEEHVRSILEKKLQKIADEFGEDKVRDILSTLQDDFDFDKIFLRTLIKDKEQTEEIERITDEICDKAKEILQKDNMLLPFSDLDLGDLKEKITHFSPRKTLFLIDKFLMTHGRALVENQKVPGLYYFKCPEIFPEYPKEFKDVAFDRRVVLNDESIELFTVRNPFVKTVLKYIENKFPTEIASSFTVTNSKHNSEGILACFEIIFDNNYGYKRKFIEPIFVEKHGTINNEISQIFNYPEMLHFIPEVSFTLNRNQTEDLFQTALKEIETKMYQTYQKEKTILLTKLQKEREALSQFYSDKENAIDKIAIENIRKAKRVELQKQKQEDLHLISVKSTLIPQIRLFELAMVELK